MPRRAKGGKESHSIRRTLAGVDGQGDEDGLGEVEVQTGQLGERLEVQEDLAEDLHPVEGHTDVVSKCTKHISLIEAAKATKKEIHHHSEEQG